MSRITHNIKTLFLACICLICLTSLSQAAEPVLKSISGEIFENSRSGQMWQMGKSRRIRTSEAAERYVEKLNQGEYSDWRLPTKQELNKLFSLFDLKHHGDVRIQLEGNYWIENKGVMAGAWEIGDQCGPSRTFYTKKAGYVRAIRP